MNQRKGGGLNFKIKKKEKKKGQKIGEAQFTLTAAARIGMSSSALLRTWAGKAAWRANFMPVRLNQGDET